MLVGSWCVSLCGVVWCCSVVLCGGVVWCCSVCGGKEMELGVMDCFCGVR